MMVHLESLSLRFNSLPQIQFKILDQTLLPWKEEWVSIRNVDECVSAIKKLKVRGAPLIGIVASLSLALSSIEGSSIEQIEKEAKDLIEARPTAVNLMHSISRMLKVVENIKSQKIEIIQSKDLSTLLLQEAIQLFNEDKKLCDEMSHFGSELILNGDRILTHCNTGGLATAGCGTALGAIIKAHQQGKNIHVYVDETRPLLQGGRLTAWELEKNKIPYTLITDSMAGHLMGTGSINKIFVGCDRIAKNGDFANKIGTYSLSVLAHYHKIPFYVVGPSTTIDWNCQSGSNIPIEQRDFQEVRGLSGAMGEWIWAPQQAPVYNPSFDVTPAHLVTAWIFNFGVFKKIDFESGKVQLCMP